MSNSVTYLNGHLYLSGIRLGVATSTETVKTCGEKRSNYVLMIIIVGSVELSLIHRDFS